MVDRGMLRDVPFELVLLPGENDVRLTLELVEGAEVLVPDRLGNAPMNTEVIPADDLLDINLGNPTQLGNTTGWFGLAVYSDAEIRGAGGNISGYPGDKPSGTQWYDARKIDSVNSRKVFYDIDTAGGQSGSAVYRIVNGNRYAFAVHAYGGASTNSGTRIVTPVFNNFVAWKA